MHSRMSSQTIGRSSISDLSSSREIPQRSASLGVKLSKSPQYRPRSDEHTHNIKVYVRCRSRNQREIDEKSSVVIATAKTQGGRELVLNGTSGKRTYAFDRVFGAESDQEAVFNETARNYIGEMLRGYNCTVFAYGQTGTGKTYTMSGDIKCVSPIDESQQSILLSEHAGIIPRMLVELFKQLPQESNDFSVRVSFLELYNEKLRDLLACDIKTADDDNTGVRFTATENIRIYDNNHSNTKSNEPSITVRGMQELYIKSAHEGLHLLTEGSLKRQVAATKCNDLSSRSHTVFTITTNTTKIDPLSGKEFVKVGKLNLVDLAGSENITRSGVGAESVRAQEAGLINKSLLTLGRVINALVDYSQHIPYRESKLTRLLQDSLGGKTKTCIIATISPAKICLEETVSTLEYATRAKSIKNTPQINQSMAKDSCITGYIREIDKLRQELKTTRDKEGIYISQEQYDLYESNCILVGEQKVRMDILEEQIKGFKDKYVEQLHSSRDAQKKLHALELSYREMVEQKLTVESSLGSLQKECNRFESEVNEIHSSNIEIFDLLSEENVKLSHGLQKKIEYIIHTNVRKEKDATSLTQVKNSLQQNCLQFQEALVHLSQKLQDNSLSLKTTSDDHFGKIDETNDLLTTFKYVADETMQNLSSLGSQINYIKDNALQRSQNDIEEEMKVLSEHYRTMENTLSTSLEKLRNDMCQELQKVSCTTQKLNAQGQRLVEVEKSKMQKLEEEVIELRKAKNNSKASLEQLQNIFEEKVTKARDGIFESVLCAVKDAKLKQRELDASTLAESTKLLCEYEKRSEEEHQASFSAYTNDALNIFDGLKMSFSEKDEKCEMLIDNMTGSMDKRLSTLPITCTLSDARNFITTDMKNLMSKKANSRINTALEDVEVLRLSLVETHKEVLSSANTDAASAARKLEDKIQSVYAQINHLNDHICTEQHGHVTNITRTFNETMFKKLNAINEIIEHLSKEYNENTILRESLDKKPNFPTVIRELPKLVHQALANIYKDSCYQAQEETSEQVSELPRVSIPSTNSNQPAIKVLNSKEINLVLQDPKKPGIVPSCNSVNYLKFKRKRSDFGYISEDDNKDAYEADTSTKKVRS